MNQASEIKHQEFDSKRPTTKHRRRRYLIVLAAGFLVLVAFAYTYYRYELEPVNSHDTSSVSFIIPSGQRVPEIAYRLREAKLIRDKNTFITYVNFHGLRSQLQAGTYSLSPDQSTPIIASILSNGRVSRDLLIIPEGSTLVQIEKLTAKKGISAASFKAALADQYSSQYASQRPAGVDLEGYLFPDGYQIAGSTTAHDLIRQMLATFDQKITPDTVAAFAAEGLSVHQGLTLASIIEKEVANSADRPVVAQVFLSRLKVGQPLQSDVTVQYAADQTGTAFNLNLDSPYNTYRTKGLPVGPICNPGIDAINAAAHPAPTTYSYFVAGKDGKTHFAHTFAEHQANVAKYLQ